MIKGVLNFSWSILLFSRHTLECVVSTINLIHYLNNHLCLISNGRAYFFQYICNVLKSRSFSIEQIELMQHHFCCILLFFLDSWKLNIQPLISRRLYHFLTCQVYRSTDWRSVSLQTESEKNNNSASDDSVYVRCWLLLHL